MSAAPGAERFPDEMELLDGSELCLHELDIDQSLGELRTLADTYTLQNLAGEPGLDTDEKAQVDLATASQKVIWHLYSTGIFISREEDFDTTKRMVRELATRIHDAFGVENVRPDRRVETVPKAPVAKTPLTLVDVPASPTQRLTKPKLVELMSKNAAEQLERDLFTRLGLQIDALPLDIAARVDHDDFVQTMISLKVLGRVSLATPLVYSANKLRALSKFAEQLATKIAA